METLILIVVVLAAILLLVFTLSVVESKSKIKVIDYVATVLNKLHIIIDGAEYIGNKSTEINDFRKIDWHTSGASANIQMLCVTNNGNWFKYEFDCNKSKHSDVKITPLTINQAKEILGSRPDIYKQYFTNPETA